MACYKIHVCICSIQKVKWLQVRFQVFQHQESTKVYIKLGGTCLMNHKVIM